MLSRAGPAGAAAPANPLSNHHCHRCSLTPLAEGAVKWAAPGRTRCWCKVLAIQTVVGAVVDMGAKDAERRAATTTIGAERERRKANAATRIIRRDADIFNVGATIAGQRLAGAATHILAGDDDPRLDHWTPDRSGRKGDHGSRISAGCWTPWPSSWRRRDARLLRGHAPPWSLLL